MVKLVGWTVRDILKQDSLYSNSCMRSAHCSALCAQFEIQGRQLLRAMIALRCLNCSKIMMSKLFDLMMSSMSNCA